MSIKDKIKGEMKKEKSGFVYYPGSIYSLEREPAPEDAREEIENLRAEGRCVRCEEKLDEGAEFCNHCGHRRNLIK
jgi:hypothetical protein